jgi:hypothetical protein
MSPTRVALFAFALSVAACGEGSGTFGVGGSGNTAKVRLVNATTISLDLLANNAVVSGPGGVASLASSTCLNVDLNLVTLAIRQTGTTTTLSGFSPTFAAGGSYTIVAYPTGNGSVQFATLPSSFTTGSGQAGLRVFDAAPTTATFDLYVTAPGAPLVTPDATNLGLGTGTSFLNVSASSDQIRFTDFGTAVVVFDAGNHTFSAGQSQVFVLAAPNGTLTSILVPVC